MPAALSVLSQLPLSRSTGCCCFRYFRISVRENSPPPSPLPNPMKGRGGERRGGGARGPQAHAQARASRINSFISISLLHLQSGHLFWVEYFACSLAKLLVSKWSRFSPHVLCRAYFHDMLFLKALSDDCIIPSSYAVTFCETFEFVLATFSLRLPAG